MEEVSYLVDGHHVDIGDGGWSIEVALTNTPPDPFRATYILAEQILDLLAAEAFRISELSDPLCEHATWLKKPRTVGTQDNHV